VFERFHQGEGDATAAREGGLGLGLALARQLVELHHGTITAASDGLGRGAAFVVTLPVVHTPLERPPSRAEAARAVLDRAQVRLDGIRVLLVEGDAETRHLLSMLLTQHGAIVTVAGAVDEGYALIERDPPDVLVSDIEFSGEDGLALIKRIRQSADPRMACLPAAALTTLNRVDDRTRVLTAGFQTQVRKPADSAELVAVVASLAELRARPAAKPAGR
jgi:CheY-like chemotaxis protein